MGGDRRSFQETPTAVGQVRSLSQVLTSKGALPFLWLHPPNSISSVLTLSLSFLSVK